MEICGYYLLVLVLSCREEYSREFCQIIGVINMPTDLVSLINLSVVTYISL